MSGGLGCRDDQINRERDRGKWQELLEFHLYHETQNELPQLERLDCKTGCVLKFIPSRIFFHIQNPRKSRLSENSSKNHANQRTLTINE